MGPALRNVLKNVVRDAFGQFEGWEVEDLSYFWEEFRKELMVSVDFVGRGKITMTTEVIALNDGEDSSGPGLVVSCGGESSSPGGLTKRISGCFEVGQGSGPESGTQEDIASEAEVHVERNGSVETKSESDIQIVHESPTVLVLKTGSSFVSNAVVAEANGSVEEAPVASKNNSDLENPLDLNDFNSAAEIQVLGLERLKAEIQAHGLKCGGTLQECASRLFLLKTTP
ncbi:hypothetical protein MKW92_037723, partial [Papaver armeniacum]